MSTKERLTVTVDPEAVAAGNRAVESGRTSSLSAWVNAALVERAARDARLEALADAVAAYESEHGVISPAELVAVERSDREQAVVVRGRRLSQRDRE